MPKPPRLRKRSSVSTRSREDDALSAATWFPDFDGVDDLFGAAVALIALVAVVLLLTTVVFPILALTAELLLVVVLFTAGAIGRLAFGRPWRIEAMTIGAPRLTREIQAKGLRGSRDAIDELADAIASGHKTLDEAAEGV
jgi:hypothetical protein